MADSLLYFSLEVEENMLSLYTNQELGKEFCRLEKRTKNSMFLNPKIRTYILANWKIVRISLHFGEWFFIFSTTYLQISWSLVLQNRQTSGPWLREEMIRRSIKESHHSLINFLALIFSNDKAIKNVNSYIFNVIS